MQDSRTRADRDDEFKELDRKRRGFGEARSTFEQLLLEHIQAALNEHDDTNDKDDDPGTREAAARAGAFLIALSIHRTNYRQIESLKNRLELFGPPEDMAEQLMLASAADAIRRAEFEHSQSARHAADAYLIAVGHHRFASKATKGNA